MTTTDRSGFTKMAYARLLMAMLLSLALPIVAMHAGTVRAASGDSTAAALVMDISGATKPQLALHREVAPGTRVTLGVGAHLSLLHYASCTIVTLSGGTATVTDAGVETDAANIESKKPGPCPRVHKIALGGPGPVGGVIVARGDPRVYLEIAQDGLVVLSGNGASDAAFVDVLDGTHKVVDGKVPIRDGSFKLNGALPPKRPYYLSIHFNGRSEPVEVPIAISASVTGALLIVRLE